MGRRPPRATLTREKSMTVRNTAMSVFVGLVLIFAPCFGSSSFAQSPVEVFEISADNTDQLPRGKEADGIIGDFVLRKEHIEATVSADLPHRKANMSTNWDWITPGCLYDLSVRGSDNDQLTYLAVDALQGAVSSVRAQDVVPGLTGVVSERTAATGHGQAVKHSYFVDSGWRYLVISSYFANRTKKDWKIRAVGVWKGLSGQKTVRGVQTGDAMNPRDKQGYAKYTVAVGSPDSDAPMRKNPFAPKDVTLKPDEEGRYITFVAPGRSPAEAWGILSELRGPVGTLRATIAHGETPIASAALAVHFDKKNALNAYPDDEGKIELSLPPGEYTLVASEIGRPSIERKIKIEADKTVDESFAMAAAARVVLEVTAGEDRPAKTPCKVQFVGINGTPDPKLGVDINAHGCRNQYHSEDGHFTQQLPPGRYRLIITHGIEFDHVVREIELGVGEEHLVHARLRRVVDTSGWISTDFHNHSTPSGDNYCGTDDRVINLAAENIEFAPTTEHNRLYDWGPHIRRLGLERELATIAGLELTGPNAHLNAFPLKVEPFTQDNGAPVWQHDPRLNAIMLRDWQGGDANRWVHLNHPSVGKFFRDRDGDGVADGGYVGLDDLVDAAEMWSLEILRKEPWYHQTWNGKKRWRESRTFAWLQLLNQGRRLWCIAVADAHSIVGNGVGGWRTYVTSSTDEPFKIDAAEITRNAKAGRMFVTNGPFLDVKLSDGTIAGGQTIARHDIGIDIVVRTTDWVEIDRVQVLVNGRQPAALNFTRKSHPTLFKAGIESFRHHVSVRLHEDAHIIVAAVGEGFDLRRGWGNTWESDMHPCAFTNPIYVDTDGHGWKPNGDTLDYPLPTAKSPIPEPEDPADQDGND
jgi:hypothetical protein